MVQGMSVPDLPPGLDPDTTYLNDSRPGNDQTSRRNGSSEGNRYKEKESRTSNHDQNGNNELNGSAQHRQGSEEDGQDTKKDAESLKEAPRSRFAAALQTFSPIWFALVMNSGILGIIMHQSPQPYNGKWWQICSYILYITSLLLFVSFLLVYLLRAILYPKSVPGPRESRPNLSVETTAISACMPISAFTIIGQTTLIASAANWNGTGYGFMLFCYIAWWAVVLWMLATAHITLVHLTRDDDMSPDDVPPACIIPGVGVVTAALVGAVVITYGHDVSPQLAIPVIFTGYILVGFGVFWAILMYSIILVKLINVGWPPPEKFPSLLFLVGPPGQTAGALVALGAASQKYLPLYGQDSPIYTVTGGQSFAAISILFALMFLGLYILWLIFAIYAILEAAVQGKLKSFTFVWWGTIFPTATGNLAFIMLAEALNSQAFAVLGCIWLVVLFVDYFACLAFTIIGIFKGDILDGREGHEKEARQKAD